MSVQTVDVQIAAKRAAAEAALEEVPEGCLLGLGSGSTAALFVEALAARVRLGFEVRCVATSSETERLAASLGIPLMTIDEVSGLDLDVDGADEIDGRLNLLKGGGGALLHEKLVAGISKRFIVIADDSKLVPALAERRPIPVEVVRFGWTHTRTSILALAAMATLRGEEQTPFHTDSGNYILDVTPAPGASALELARGLKQVSGVVDHGIFEGMAGEAIIGRADGTVTRMPQPAD